MAKTIVLDFLHYYKIGERREANSLAYQWDKGHVLEARVPKNTGYQLHYHMNGMELADGYAPASFEEADEGYILTARIPNIYFTSAGDLVVFLVTAGEDELTTTYEGVIRIKSRAQPTEYVDFDPENSAKDLYAATLENAKTAEAWAVGTMRDIPVESGDDQYHNNAKYYAEQNAASVATVTASATAAASSAASASGSASAASASATSASGSATAAASSASTAQAAAEAAQQAAAEAGAEGYVENSQISIEEAATRENLVSGETVKGLFGKVKKWFTDLGEAAFRSVANNLTTELEGSVLDARQGKALSDRLTTDETTISSHTSSLSSHSTTISSLSSTVSSHTSTLNSHGSRISAVETAVNSGKIASYVGMIIFSSKLDTAAKVKAIYGGTTWVQIQGRMLIGASGSYSNGATGGAASVSYKPAGTVGGHTLTLAEIPSHSHTFPISYQGNTGSNNGFLRNTTAGTGTQTTSAAGGGGSHNHSFTGTSATIATMPPYRAVYIWERTA